MNAFREMIKRFAREHSGLETVEYVVLAGLFTAAAVLAIMALGSNVAGKFAQIVVAFGG